MLGLAAGCAFAQLRDEADGDLKLTVVVYDRAQVSPETLTTAESTVEQVFAGSGVRLVWRDGMAYRAERHKAFPPPPEDPATLVLTFQPQSEIRRYRVRSACGGFAHDASAIVFVRRMEEAKLGYVIAHELGHLLLGPDTHSLTGIMRPTLTPQDWQKASQGMLGFTSSQNQQIRKWITEHGPSLTSENGEPTPASTDGDELQVDVNVYNGIHLPSEELLRAQGEAARIFHYAGIQLRWASGLMGSDVNNGTPSGSSSPLTLQLRLWPRAIAGKRPSSSDTLGFCLSLENGDAVVLADAIQKHAVIGSTHFADLLGLAMAHELGHLLLRSTTHSVTGIMRARLTEKALRDDDRGYLRFSAAEAESMRNEVRRRVGVESASK